MRGARRSSSKPQSTRPVPEMTLMVLAARAAASTVVGASGVPVLSTLLPSLPARRPPTDVGHPAPAPSPLGGAGPGLNRGVCAQRGREPPGLGSRGPSNHKGFFACRSDQRCSWNSGNLRWAAPPGAGACTDPKLPLQAQGSLSLMASRPSPAWHPHPTRKFFPHLQFQPPFPH